MKIRSLEKALCAAMLSMLAAQPISHAEEPAGGGTTAETLFAYTSSIHRPHPNHDAVSDIPSYVPLELTPVDPSAWAHATMNATMRFRVVHDVILGQYAYAYAGTLIDAKVTRIREGELRIRRGRMEPRVKEITVEGSLKLTLESSPRSRFSGKAKHLATLPLTAIRIIFVDVPAYVLLVIFCSTGCDF